MRKFLVVLALLAGFIVPHGYGSIFDDFEDGDYTSDPSWHLEINQGASEIANDPIRTSNFTYKVHGTASGNRSICTYTNDKVSWVGLDISFEFLATDWGFHPQWDVCTSNSNYTLGFGFWLDPSWNTIRLYPSERRTRLMEYSVEIQPTDFALNTWHRIHTFHDLQTNYITTEIQTLNDNAIVATISYMPTDDFTQLPFMERFYLGVEETNWQFFDNVALVPEPSTAILVGVASMVLTRRRTW